MGGVNQMGNAGMNPYLFPSGDGNSFFNQLLQSGALGGGGPGMGWPGPKGQYWPQAGPGPMDLLGGRVS